MAEVGEIQEVPETVTYTVQEYHDKQAAAFKQNQEVIVGILQRLHNLENKKD